MSCKTRHNLASYVREETSGVSRSSRYTDDSLKKTGDLMRTISTHASTYPRRFKSRNVGSERVMSAYENDGTAGCEDIQDLCRQRGPS